MYAVNSINAYASYGARQDITGIYESVLNRVAEAPTQNITDRELDVALDQLGDIETAELARAANDPQLRDILRLAFDKQESHLRGFARGVTDAYSSNISSTAKGLFVDALA